MLLRRSWPAKTLTALMAVTVLAGCQNSQQTGTLLGALGGAAAGYAIGDGKWWAVGAGALVCGVVGNQVGAYLDERDRQTAYSNANYALNNNADGQTSTWSNPEKGTGGYTKPTQTYQSAGSTCRTYQTGVTANGQSQSGTGQACRQPDGTWKLVN